MSKVDRPKGWHVVCVLPFGQRVHWNYLRANWKERMKDYPSGIIWGRSQDEAHLFFDQAEALAAKFLLEDELAFDVIIVGEDERCDPRKAWILPQP